MTLRSAQAEEAGTRDSVVMLAALGMLAYAASTMTHEALGHGGYCVAAGGHNVMLTGWRESCDFPGVAPLGIKAAGPGVQFVAGLLAWLGLRFFVASNVRLRYFLWLYMAFNLLTASSYVAFSGFTDFGDAADLIAGVQRHEMWRAVLVVLGSVVYLLSLAAAAAALRRLCDGDCDDGRLDRLVWIPYGGAGVFACCSAALNRTMGLRAALGLAVLSSIGSGAGLLCLPTVLGWRAGNARFEAAYLRWSTGWGFAAAVVVLVFLLVIGPGVK